MVFLIEQLVAGAEAGEVGAALPELLRALQSLRLSELFRALQALSEILRETTTTRPTTATATTRGQS